MLSADVFNHFTGQVSALRSAALLKSERVLVGKQATMVTVAGMPEAVLNLCSNNYLGLSDDASIGEAAQHAIDRYGFGLSSVRGICGTHEIHKVLEQRLSDFLTTEDTILYSSCFDANAGLFETLFDERDVIVSDDLNHASIIDGIRLSKAKRYRYRNSDMAHLESQLEDADGARFKIIATDGVFSMDGTVANLPGICDLADRHQALVMVDDSHAVGFFGPAGRGTPEHHGVQHRIDLLTGTFGKALGGASGGYISGHRPIVEWLRQRSRPYMFSNTLAPMIAAATIAALDKIERDDSMRIRLWANAADFRNRMQAMGFEVGDGISPIVPIMLGDASVAAEMSQRLLNEGVFAIPFFYPVVPEGRARIRVQLSAAHTRGQIAAAAEAFARVRDSMLVNAGE